MARAASDQLFAVEICCHGQPLMIVNFDSRAGSCQQERQELGSFNLYDDIVVQVGLQNVEEEDDDTAERISIPVMCFDREKPAPLLLQHGPIEVNVVFDVEEAQYESTLPERASRKGPQAVGFYGEECKFEGDSSGAPIRVLSSRRTVLTVHTSDLYHMTKRVLSDLARGQKARLVQFLRVLRTLSSYLMDSTAVVALVVADLNSAFLERLDCLVAQSLASLDSQLDAGGRLVLDSLQLFVRLLKRQLNWAEAALVSTARTALTLASPALRIGWAIGKPFAVRGRSLARPLLSPLLDRAHEYVTSSTSERGPASVLLEDGLQAVREFIQEGSHPRTQKKEGAKRK